MFKLRAHAHILCGDHRLRQFVGLPFSSAYSNSDSVRAKIFRVGIADPRVYEYNNRYFFGARIYVKYKMLGVVNRHLYEFNRLRFSIHVFASCTDAEMIRNGSTVLAYVSRSQFFCNVLIYLVHGRRDGVWGPSIPSRANRTAAVFFHGRLHCVPA